MKKHSSFLELMSVLRRGSLQLSGLSDFSTKAILLYSFYQNIGKITGHRHPVDSLASSESLFVFSSFISFDMTTQLQGLTVLSVTCNLLFLLYIFTQIILLAFQASEIKSGSKKTFFDPSRLFKPGFMDTIIQIYIWVLFVPMWELAFAPITGKCMPRENIAHPVSLLEMSYSKLAFNDAGLFGLSIASLVSQVVWVVLLIGWFLPRNPIPDNHLVIENRLFDLMVVAHKIPTAFRILFIYVMPPEGQIAMSLIRGILLTLQIVIALNQLTFTRVSTMRFFVRGAFVNLAFEILQFITVFGVWADFPISSISFEQATILTTVFFFVSGALERHVFWKKLESAIEAPSDSITSGHLFGYFTLYRFAKENSFHQFVYNGEDSLEDVSRYHQIVISHFSRCGEKEKCVCNFLKSGDSFWDKQACTAIFIKKIDPSGFENWKTVCSVGFIKLIIKNMLDGTVQEGQTDPHVLFQYLRHLMFEEPDYFNATLLLSYIKHTGIVPPNQTDLQFLDAALRREIQYSSNHKVLRSNFPNLEKFLAILTQTEVIQDQMVDAAECLVAILRAISDQKSADELRFQLIWESLASFEIVMKGMRDEFFDLPKNLRLLSLCREFVSTFCQDFHADQILKKRILDPMHRFNRNTT